MPKSCHIFVAVWIVLCAAGAPGQVTPQAQPGAYDSLDPSVLSAALRELQMWEVHDYLTEQLGAGVGSTAAVLVKAEALIDKAIVRGTALPERRSLLNQAITAIRQIVASTANPPDDKALIKHLGYKLKLAATAGGIRAEPYALRLMYLQGAEQDRRDVVRLTARASSMMIELESETSDLLVEWRADLEKLVTAVPPLRQLHGRVLYQAAWVYLYRGLALPKGQEKKQFLAMARMAAQKCGQRGQRPYRSRLVQGIAARAQGQHRDADKLLLGLNVARVPNNVRIQAMFEAARNLAEEGKSEEALEAVDTFSETRSKLLGESAKLQTDLHSAILRGHVYGVQANKETVVKRKKALLDKAFKALVEVIQKHGANPGVRGTIFEIVARKYGRDVDPADAASIKRAHSMALLALAFERVKQRSGEPNALNEAITMLKEVLGRDDSVATMMRADTIWNMAFAYHELRDNVKAGQKFAELAKKFPKHALAHKAAMNATATFRGIISERIENKKPVSSAIRKEFVAALEVLLGNAQWVKASEVASQFYDLAWQYEKLAMTAPKAEKPDLRRKAVEAYKKVPESNLKDYMGAQHQALAMEVELLDAAKEAKEEVPLSVAEDLVKRLTAYAERARLEAPKVGDKDKDLAKDFMTWGSRAAFNVATVNYNHMDRQDRAMKMLKALPGQWPQTSVLEESNEFLISKLMEQGKAMEASREVEKFIKEHPQRGAQLIALVIQNIREKIKAWSKDLRRVKEVAAYREGYRHLAKLLYDNAAEDPNTTPQQLLNHKQRYGLALTEPGSGKAKAEEALKLFRECKAEEDKKLEVERNRIDKEYVKQIEDMEATKVRGPRDLHQAINEVIKTIPKAPLTGEARAIVISEIVVRDGKEEETFRYLTGVVKKAPTGYEVWVNVVVRFDPKTKKPPQLKIQQSTFTAAQVKLIVPQDAAQAITLFKANIYLKDLLKRSSGATTTVATTQVATTRPTQATAPAAIKNKAELDEAVMLVLEAYDTLMNVRRMVRKKDLEQDPANFWGLAKSHFALKQYFEALPFYRQLSVRIDPNKNNLAYWQAQLGYCRCALEALRKVKRKLKEDPQKNEKKLKINTERLEGLRAFMRELEIKDPGKGGLIEEYNRIQTELRSLLAE